MVDKEADIKGGKEMKKGQISITVQTEKRMEAINNLSRAIADVAYALKSGPEVIIKDCTIKTSGTGISLDTTSDGVETKTERL